VRRDAIVPRRDGYSSANYASSTETDTAERATPRLTAPRRTRAHPAGDRLHMHRFQAWPRLLRPGDIASSSVVVDTRAVHATQRPAKHLAAPHRTAMEHRRRIPSPPGAIRPCILDALCSARLRAHHYRPPQSGRARAALCVQRRLRPPASSSSITHLPETPPDPTRRPAGSTGICSAVDSRAAAILRSRLGRIRAPRFRITQRERKRRPPVPIGMVTTAPIGMVPDSLRGARPLSR